MDYPFGKAALWILLLALASGAALFVTSHSESAVRPDLVYMTFSKDHAEAYRPLIAQFEKEHHVRVQLQIIDLTAMQDRLTAALQVGAEVPDLAEFGATLMGMVTKGPLEDVGFWDLTNKVHETGLDQHLVMSRVSNYTKQGHIFALPHDVHPVMLAYRRDIVEQLGIDVSKLTTWDEFVKVGREITRDTNGDGVIDRYMIDLPDDSSAGIQLLLLQRGIPFFDAQGRVNFDNDTAVDTVCWYVHQTEGPGKISFNCGWGQNFSRSMIDGLALFYICPDWRSRQFENDIPSMKGKLALIPLPAWEPGGCRTSTWGGTAVSITKACKNKELAWELLTRLYFDKAQLAQRWGGTSILPALKDAWNMPVYDQPNPFYSNQPIGRLYANLAPDVHADYATPYWNLAQNEMGDAYIDCKLYYRDHGDAGLRDFCRRRIHQAAEKVRRVQARNVFADQ